MVFERCSTRAVRAARSNAERSRWCRTAAQRCYTPAVPTVKPRYTLTDTGHLREVLDAAQRRWPEITNRKALLLRLVEQGHESLGLEEHAAEERHKRAQLALARIPSLVDAELLLSDQAWT